MATLLRIAVCIICIATTWYVVDYVFNRNLMAEIYPPEADSISIPIISNQILLLTLGLLILPTTLLASTRVVSKLSTLRGVFQIVILIPFAGFYGLSMLICLGLTLSAIDRHHIELGMSYAVMLALIITAFMVDVIRIYRRLYKKQIPH
jgi:hypothetical protein